MTRKKYEKPLALDMEFDEALGRFAQVLPSEMPGKTESMPVDGTGPVHLYEDDDTGDRFLVYVDDNGVHHELRITGDQPWFTQKQLAQMFGVSVRTVGDHVNKFIEDGELGDSVTRKFRVTAADGKEYDTTHYSLDVAFYVGYRVNSSAGVLFRKWATAVLIQFATKGFVIDKRRLKEPDAIPRVRELREIIKELRASEANLYSELRDICAMCADYKGDSDAAETFYRNMQAKIFYAVTSHTPAGVIQDRADASAENMGLQTWSGARGVTKRDVTVGKNYLADPELEEFSRLVSIVLDILDDQLKVGRLTMMDQCSARLDEELGRLGRPVLRHPGPPSKVQADAYALGEYEKFDQRRKLEKQRATKAELANLKQTNATKKPDKKR